MNLEQLLQKMPFTDKMDAIFGINPYSSTREGIAALNRVKRLESMEEGFRKSRYVIGLVFLAICYVLIFLMKIPSLKVVLYVGVPMILAGLYLARMKNVIIPKKLKAHEAGRENYAMLVGKELASKLNCHYGVLSNGCNRSFLTTGCLYMLIRIKGQ